MSVKLLRFSTLTSGGVVQPSDDGKGPRAYYHKVLRGRCWDCRRPPNRSTLTFSEGEAMGFKDCRSIPMCRECSRVSAAGDAHSVHSPRVQVWNIVTFAGCLLRRQSAADQVQLRLL